MSELNKVPHHTWKPTNLTARIDLVTFKLFVAVIEEQSIIKAAEREAIAPSAVSKRMADLESAARIQLLVRQRKGVRPTPAGDTMLHYARTILREIGRLEAEIGEHVSGARDIIRIAASESALLSFVPKVLSSFSRKYPNIKIDLETRVSPEVVRSVIDGQADVGIFWGSSGTAGLTVLPCYVDNLVIVVPTTHPLAKKESVSFAEALEHEFIEQEPNSAVQALLERTANELGRPLKSRIRVNTYDAAASMAIAGFGLAVVPDSFASRLANIRGYATVRLDERWAKRQYNVGIGESREVSHQIRMLLDHITAHI